MDDEVQKSVEESLRPLYFLTKSFLHFIRPNYDDIEVFIQNLKANFYEHSSIHSSLLQEWKLLLKHYLGPTLVIFMGLIFGLILFFIALYAFFRVFCCRCLTLKSNKIQGGQKLQACIRGFFSSILIIVSTIILACGICIFVTNNLLFEQTAIPPNNLNSTLIQHQFLLPSISNSIETIRNLKDNTIEELQSHIYLNLKQKLINIVEHIREIPVEFANQFLTSSSLSKALDLSKNFLSVINNVTEILQKLQDGKQKLVDQQHILKRSLTEIKHDLLTNVPRQCRTRCLQTRENIINIKINVDYNEIKDLTNVLKWMRISINDLQDSISKAKELYADIVEKFKDSTDSISKDVKLKVDKVLLLVDHEFTRIINIIDQVKIDDYQHYFNEHIVPQVNKYGKLRYGISFAIGMIILLWAIFSYMGICCMACSDSYCRRRKANRMLQISFGLIMIFAWCFCFVAIILFVVGSAIYFETCSAVLYQQNTTAIKLVDLMINDWLNETHDEISIIEILRKCEDNEAIHSILKLDSKLNISQLISINMANLQQYLDNSKIKVHFDFKDFQILGQDVGKELNKLALFEDHFDNFLKFDQILNKEVTTPSISSIIDDINSDSEAYDTKSLSKLLNLNTLISTMDFNRNHFRQHLEFITEEINKKSSGEGVLQRTTDIVNVLTKAQNFVRKNGTTEIERLLKQYSIDIISDMDSYLNSLNSKIKNDLVQCRPLYDMIISSSSVVCEIILNPFNGFWFSILVATILSIFMLCSIRFIILSKYSIEDQLPSFDTNDPRSQPLIKNIY